MSAALVRGAGGLAHYRSGRMSSSRKRWLSHPLPKLAEYSCSRDEKDDRAGSSSVLGMQLRGVNLHGWLVLHHKIVCVPSASGDYGCREEI